MSDDLAAVLEEIRGIISERKAAVREALAGLAEAELACRGAERASWPYGPDPSHRRRADAAMSRWRWANHALVDARLAGLDLRAAITAALTGGEPDHG